MRSVIPAKADIRRGALFSVLSRVLWNTGSSAIADDDGWNATDCLNRRASQRGVDHLRQCFELERFLQRGAVAVFGGKTGRTIAGREGERADARGAQFGDGG